MRTDHGAALMPFGPRVFGQPLLLVLGIAAVQVMGSYFASHGQPETRSLDLLALVLLVAGPAALIVRRRHPAGVLVVVLAVTLAYLLLDYARGPVFISLAVALVGAVMSGRRTAAVATAAAGYVSFLWLTYLVGVEPAPTLAKALGIGAWLLVVITVAEIARGKRERAVESARAHAEGARRRASEERLRIARELHDVLAHNISLISVQAGVALHLMDERPEQARTALTAIKQASNEALDELRSVLDVLRHRDDKPPRSPTSGLADLDRLIAKMKAAGLEISSNLQGSPMPLPRRVDLAAFRIVQEALTNVARHAANARATVEVVYGRGELIVQVDDDGRTDPSRPPGSGKGIQGMRERATAVGGSLDAGARPEGGFRVRARLPYESDGSRLP